MAKGAEVQPQKAENGTAKHADKEQEEEANKGPLASASPQSAIKMAELSAVVEVKDVPLSHTRSCDGGH